MSGKRHAEVLHELAVLNARIDDLVGMVADIGRPVSLNECAGYRTTDARPGRIQPMVHTDHVHVDLDHVHVDLDYCSTCDRGGHICPGCGVDAPHSMTDPEMASLPHYPGCPLHGRPYPEATEAMDRLRSIGRGPADFNPDRD